MPGGEVGGDRGALAHVGGRDELGAPQCRRRESRAGVVGARDDEHGPAAFGLDLEQRPAALPRTRVETVGLPAVQLIGGDGGTGIRVR